MDLGIIVLSPDDTHTTVKHRRRDNLSCPLAPPHHASPHFDSLHDDSLHDDSPHDSPHKRPHDSPHDAALTSTR